MQEVSKQHRRPQSRLEVRQLNHHQAAASITEACLRGTKQATTTSLSHVSPLVWCQRLWLLAGSHVQAWLAACAASSPQPTGADFGGKRNQSKVLRGKAVAMGRFVCGSCFWTRRPPPPPPQHIMSRQILSKRKHLPLNNFFIRHCFEVFASLLETRSCPHPLVSNFQGSWS